MKKTKGFVTKGKLLKRPAATVSLMQLRSLLVQIDSSSEKYIGSFIRFNAATVRYVYYVAEIHLQPKVRSNQ